VVARAALFFSDHGKPAVMRSPKRTMPGRGHLDQTDGVTVALRGSIDRPIASNTKRRGPAKRLESTVLRLRGMLRSTTALTCRADRCAPRMRWSATATRPTTCRAQILAERSPAARYSYEQAPSACPCAHTAGSARRSTLRSRTGPPAPSWRCWSVRDPDAATVRSPPLALPRNQ